MSVEYSIVCDGCGAILDASQRSADDARTSIRLSDQWPEARVSQRGGRDYCSSACRERL